MFANQTNYENTDIIQGVVYSTANDTNITNEKPTIATPNYDYTVMFPKWKMINTLIGGTDAMRCAGRKYLLPHLYESDDNYETRRKKAVLKNYTKRTLENLVSKAFKDAPYFTDATNEEIKKLTTNIDLQGNALSIFLRKWFESGLKYGYTFCIIDFNKTSNSNFNTAADELGNNVRPYWRILDPIDVTYTRYENYNGVQTLVELRIKEVSKSTIDYIDTYTNYIRVLVPGKWILFQEDSTNKNKWNKVDEGTFDLDYIPVVLFSTDLMNGCLICNPPLEDLAYVNIAHFQSASDQQTILTVTRFPILAVSGAQVGSDSEIVIGPNKWLSSADPQSRIYYVEHKGDAINAGRQDLEDLEDQMASYGSEFLRKRPGSSAATGRVLDSAEAIAPLVAWGLMFKEAVNQAMKVTADWFGVKLTGECNFDVKPDIEVGENNELQLLTTTRDRRDISRKAFLKELVRRDILTPDYDIEKDQKEIDNEPINILNNTPGPGSGNSPMGGKTGRDRTSGEPPINQT